MSLAVVAVLALAAPGVANADIPGRSAHLSRKVKPADRVSKKVVRSATREGGLAPHVPRTGLPEIGAAENRLFKQLQSIANGRILRGSKTAVYLVDADTGEEIYAVREDAPVNPASNVKLVSTAAALETLGADWRYQTRVFGPTPRGGVADGDVYLLGTFDPTLATRHIEALAWQLADRGITRIDGDILVGPDDQRDAVARPRVQVKVTGVEGGAPPMVELLPANDAVLVEVTATTITRGKSKLSIKTEPIAEPAGGPTVKIVVSGKVRVGTTRSYWRWMRDRGAFTGHVLCRALIDAGVDVRGTVRATDFADYVRLAGPSYLPVELATHESVPLSRIVATINKRSKNRMADRVLMTAGAAAFGGEPTMDKGVRLMHAWLTTRAHVADDDVLLDTGSGLSYNTRLSARSVVTVLREATGMRGADETDGSRIDPRLTEVYRQSLAVAGVDGTLRHRFKGTPIQSRFLGKTGTLLRVIALSGVLETRSGRRVALAIVTNDHRRGLKRSVKREHERMLKSIYGYLER